MDTITSFPCIGSKAPSFEADSTEGKIAFPADYAGKWVIFFSHPADFTPVCTSEFLMFAQMEQKFRELNTRLVGLSVDGLYGHIAWLQSIREHIEFNGIKDIEIRFPLVEDLSGDIAHTYGMIQAGESDKRTIRAVFFIDPAGIIQAIIYYPLNLGRNFEELYRVIVGLQTSSTFHVSLPANWKPGKDVIVPAPKTSEKAQARLDQKDTGSVHCQDWYYCTQPLAEEEIWKKLRPWQDMKF